MEYEGLSAHPEENCGSDYQLTVRAQPPVPLLEDGDCQASGIAELCQPRQPYNIQSIQELRAYLIHPRGPATKELLNYLNDFTPSDGPAISRVCFLYRSRVSGIKEVLEEFLGSPYSLPESICGSPKDILFHIVTELLPMDADNAICLPPRECSLFG